MENQENCCTDNLGECKDCQCNNVVKKEKKGTAKTFVLESLKEGSKTIIELAQEYIDKGLTQKDLKRTKLQMAVTLNTLKKEGKTKKVGNKKHALTE